MTVKQIPPTTVRLLGATALATILAFMPVGLTMHGPVDSVAFAKGGGDGGGGHGGGGDKGGGDRGGDKGDRGGDKSAAADRNDGGHADRGRGNDIASRGRDVGASSGPTVASLGRDFGRNDGRHDGRDSSRSVADRRDSPRSGNTLGNLNAAHASATARAHASPNSMVGRVATYEIQMQAALAIQDRAARNAAIVAAREQLATSANKPLTRDNIARVDSMLGIRGAPPSLGAERRDISRVSFDDRRDRDFRDHHGFRDGLESGLGFGNLPVDPARIEARAAAIDARGDRRAAEIRANADRVAAGIVSRAEAKAAELRAQEATAKNPAALEARAVAIVERANSVAAAIVAKADARATAMTARVDDRVETLQAIAAYDRAVIAALALDDPAAQASAIAAARTDLRAAIDRPISGRAIDRLDDRLGLDGTPTAVASRDATKATGVDG